MPPRDVTAPLTINERLAALTRATGASQEEAAESAHLPLSRLKKLEKDPRFIAEFQRGQSRLMPDLGERLQQRLAALQEPAVERLGQLMDGAESEAVQFQSARHILERGPLGPLAQGRGSNDQGHQGFSFDQGALQAIMSGAINAGISSVIGACAALAGVSPPPTPALHAQVAPPVPLPWFGQEGGHSGPEESTHDSGRS